MLSPLRMPEDGMEVSVQPRFGGLRLQRPHGQSVLPQPRRREAGGDTALLLGAQPRAGGALGRPAPRSGARPRGAARSGAELLRGGGPAEAAGGPPHGRASSVARDRAHPVPVRVSGLVWGFGGGGLSLVDGVF